MLLQAVSIGYAVPRDSFDAEVHSILDTSANLKLAGDGLLTLFTSEHHDLPQGIRLNTRGIVFNNLRIGQKAACRAGILRSAGLYPIDLRAARQWKCDLTSLYFDINNPRTKSAWQTVWAGLNHRQERMQAQIQARGLFEPINASALGRKIGPRIQALISATKTLHPVAATEPASQIIGLGPGVTPSGDDILLGYLAGLWSTLGGQLERLSFLSSFSAGLLRLAEQTNDISQTYLFHAVQGQFSSSLDQLIQVIASRATVEELIQIAEAAMAVGYSSGMDAVTGLLIGLGAWDTPSLLTLFPPEAELATRS